MQSDNLYSKILKQNIFLTKIEYIQNHTHKFQTQNILVKVPGKSYIRMQKQSLRDSYQVSQDSDKSEAVSKQNLMIIKQMADLIKKYSVNKGQCTEEQGNSILDQNQAQTMNQIDNEESVQTSIEQNVKERIIQAIKEKARQWIQDQQENQPKEINHNQIIQHQPYQNQQQNDCEIIENQTVKLNKNNEAQGERVEEKSQRLKTRNEAQELMQMVDIQKNKKRSAYSIRQPEIQNQKATSKKTGKQIRKTQKQLFKLQKIKIFLTHDKFIQQFVDLSEKQSSKYEAKKASLNTRKKIQDLSKQQQIGQIVRQMKIVIRPEKFNINQMQSNKPRSSILKKKMNSAQQIKQDVVQSKIQVKLPQKRQNPLMRFKERLQGPINIGSFTLAQLVKQIFEKKLITQNTYEQFIQYSSQNSIKQFIQKFYQDTIRRYDFKKYKFTIIDHRRISELLINLFPEEYYSDNQSSDDKDINDFIKNVYDLQPQDYYELYTKIDSISRIIWWSQIIVKNNAKIREGVKKTQQNAQNVSHFNKTMQFEKIEDGSPRKKVKFA